MRPMLFASLFAISIGGCAIADDFETTPSSKSVTDTMDALVAAVEGAGATVFARVDHTAGAQSVGLDMTEAQLLIFGNPALGTPVMQEDPRAGLVLPLRVLVYADRGGQTQVLYEEVDEMVDEFDVDDDMEALQKIEGALERLTAAAVAQ
ncbi:DUF302 domain-containing protein [Aestuariibius insulae]|uniref:DUF302 domain-containing protein n=1 Tax=Aestuariibius insulae TaxID=2058287 RepID=UPI00345ED55F